MTLPIIVQLICYKYIINCMLVLLPIGCQRDWMSTFGNCNSVLFSNGDPAPRISSIVYLGGLIEGKPGPEVRRRIGKTKIAFRNLMRNWRHATFTRSRKLQIYKICNISKLLYNNFHYHSIINISTIWEAMQIGIPHTSNEAVRDMLGEMLLSDEIRLYQLNSLELTLRQPQEHLARIPVSIVAGPCPGRQIA